MPDHAPRPLRELDLAAHLADPATKQAFVTPMFDLVASSYDRFTRRFSFGMDAQWKRALLTALAPCAGERTLDLACGTGDLAVACAAVGCAAHGVDASAAMIALAQRRSTTATFAVGDMMALDAPAASVDAITASYAFRNVPVADAALAECARVLRPGGRIAVLDFYRPPSRLWEALFLWYLRRAGDLVGWLWHDEPIAYGYIAPSIRAWMTAAQFTARLDRAGFALTTSRRWLGGAVAMHVAVRR
ncbi:MAG: ubiquinone/menaquinone biosynthesis methyltransferase [Gemmatimonadaceae bacterium]|nr:ubiquinone/menaquinone biosynthesis methyltransferase [Gemmatimonadaceae bacterium]